MLLTLGTTQYSQTLAYLNQKCVVIVTLPGPGICRDINERGACLPSNTWACTDPNYTWILDDCQRLCDNCPKEGPYVGDSNGGGMCMLLNFYQNVDVGQQKLNKERLKLM